MQYLASLAADFWQNSVLVPWLCWIAGGLVVERLFGALQTKGRIWLNLRVMLFYSLVTFAVGPAIFLAINSLAQHFGLGLFDLGWLAAKPLPLQALVGLTYFFVLDFFVYWFHRMQHEVGWMWDIHLVHHSDTEFNVTTTTLHSWMHLVVMSIGVALPMTVLFKMPYAVVAAVGVFATGLMFLSHLNVRWSFGALSWLLVGPQVHRIHHSIEPEHHNKNFAGAFPIYDILFGTYWRPAPDEFPATGVQGAHISSATQAAIYPLRKWGGVLVGKVMRSVPSLGHHRS
jgi:sterol desaturase/sphingolipid hydroxylase (fatty acid hydroxylase superfamily)